jgi:ectoine hydroxylase-related dioxygenase (phytanoyl-CoA dioxygenase family)
MSQKSLNNSQVQNDVIAQRYLEQGYVVLKNAFSAEQIKHLTTLVTEFHQAWLRNNQGFYQTKAVNSAYLTSTEYLGHTQRLELLQFIGCHTLMKNVRAVLGASVCFMNSQLFFNPFNPEQKNYWHRDPQYHLTLEQQKQALQGPEVIHFRVPLMNEVGLELVPGSHKRWDNLQQLNVRLEQNGASNYDDLTDGKVIPLNAGDLLIFSANMLHRGLYGGERLTLDLLFCEPVAELLDFVKADCLPEQADLAIIEDSQAFQNTLVLKSQR